MFPGSGLSQKSRPFCFGKAYASFGIYLHASLCLLKGQTCMLIPGLVVSIWRNGLQKFSLSF